MNQPLQSLAELVAGAKYRVLATFVDFDGGEVLAGSELTFVSQSYFPYDGGYTLTFAERVVRLAEIDANSSQVIDAPGRWFECVAAG